MPRPDRLLLHGQAVILVYGGIVHVAQLATGGWPPYSWAPAWLAAYFTALTLLDPLAAALLWARRRAGIVLAAAVLLTDAAANAYATYGIGGGSGLDRPATRVAQAVITVLALVALAGAPHLWTRIRTPS